MLGDMEMAFALAVALILFGPEKLPELAKQAGEAVNRLREAFEGKEYGG